MIDDPWHPSSSEVRAWAYDASARDPCEDWDLSLAWARHERDYLELASDPNCPKRQFFLQVLYLIAGDAVRNEYKATPEAVLRGFLAAAESYPNPDVQLWRARTLGLMQNPETFNYDDWCAGGLVRAAT
jgi:hypothetical protein